MGGGVKSNKKTVKRFVKQKNLMFVNVKLISKLKKGYCLQLSILVEMTLDSEIQFFDQENSINDFFSISQCVLSKKDYVASSKEICDSLWRAFGMGTSWRKQAHSSSQR